MRARAALVALLASGCGISLLPTTLFYTPLSETAEPDASAWAALLAASPSATTRARAETTSVVASEHLESGDWLAWTSTSTTDPSRVEGTLFHARRTAIGLEAQAIGTHVGPAVRATLRAFRVDRAVLVVVESSADERSIERAAWIYVEREQSIAPIDLADGVARMPLRRDTVLRVDARWDRTRTVTATLESAGDALVVHEHATVREVARQCPEIPARAVREIDRDRRLVLDGDRLVADRPSLFDEP